MATINWLVNLITILITLLLYFGLFFLLILLKRWVNQFFYFYFLLQWPQSFNPLATCVPVGLCVQSEMYLNLTFFVIIININLWVDHSHWIIFSKIKIWLIFVIHWTTVLSAVHVFIMFVLMQCLRLNSLLSLWLALVYFKFHCWDEIHIRWQKWSAKFLSETETFIC